MEIEGEGGEEAVDFREYVMDRTDGVSVIATAVRGRLNTHRDKCPSAVRPGRPSRRRAFLGKLNANDKEAFNDGSRLEADRQPVLHGRRRL